MDQHLDDANSHFKEGLSWQAHKGPVLSIVMSSFGKLAFIILPFWKMIITVLIGARHGIWNVIRKC
jgi:hypothetical protein